DDDSGGDLNARIIYTTPQDGEFRIIAANLSKGPGSFTLTVRQGGGGAWVKVPRCKGGRRWKIGIGDCAFGHGSWWALCCLALPQPPTGKLANRWHQWPSRRMCPMPRAAICKCSIFIFPTRRTLPRSFSLSAAAGIRAVASQLLP